MSMTTRDHEHLDKEFQKLEGGNTIKTKAAFPEIKQEAFYGLAGDFARVIEPHTEADPVALLVQFLAAFGNVIGRTAYTKAEADKHYTNLYVVLVGGTGEGRKGTSWGHVKKMFSLVDNQWMLERIQPGLSTGEGLIWAVRDPIKKQEPIKKNGIVEDYQEIVTDGEIQDKRLFAYQAEFASVLKVMQRDGNILSAVIREAWETGNLNTLTKNNPATATGAHVSLNCHITPDELRRYLHKTEAGNGFANRFLWVYVKRSKFLSRGGKLQEKDCLPFVSRLHHAIDFARGLTEPLEFDHEAGKLWDDAYVPLSKGVPGLLGAILSRATAQVLRLSCIYALLDLSAEIRAEHLNAALAVWDYCKNSCRYIFGDMLGDPEADAILQALRNSPQGLTRTAINGLFQRNKESDEISRALKVLQDANFTRCDFLKTSGRATEIWYAL